MEPRGECDSSLLDTPILGGPIRITCAVPPDRATREQRWIRALALRRPFGIDLSLISAE